MKVKDLIKMLEELDPEDEIKIECECYYNDDIELEEYPAKWSLTGKGFYYLT